MAKGTPFSTTEGGHRWLAVLDGSQLVTLDKALLGNRVSQLASDKMD